MTATAEALQLLNLVSDAKKWTDRLQELTAKIEAADKATLALQAAEKAAEQSSAAKLQVAEALLQSLTDQAESIQAANAATEAKNAAAAATVAAAGNELDVAKQRHADEVARALQELTIREEQMSLKQHALDAHIAGQTAALHDGQGRLRGHHLELRQIINETRARIAAAS